MSQVISRPLGMQTNQNKMRPVVQVEFSDLRIINTYVKGGHDLSLKLMSSKSTKLFRVKGDKNTHKHDVYKISHV